MVGTLLGTNISHFKGTFESMIFLFPRWDMLIPWWVNVPVSWSQSHGSVMDPYFSLPGAKLGPRRLSSSSSSERSPELCRLDLGELEPCRWVLVFWRVRFEVEATRETGLKRLGFGGKSLVRKWLVVSHPHL